MMWHYFGPGPASGLFLFLPLLFWALVIWLIVVLWRGHYHHDHAHGHHNQDPLSIAKARYARGDITKDEFEQIKKDLI